MSFKTASELIAFSTGTFVDNSNGLITPTMFRNMHEHLVDSLNPYDASGVYSIKILDTGNVPTPTTSGAVVFDTGVPALHLFNGTSWISISGGGGGGSSYTAGSGLELAGTEFNAILATTSATGVVKLTNTIDASQDKALTPKAVFDAGYLTTESDTLQTVTDRGSDTTNSITSSGNITATTGILDVLDLTLLANGSQPAYSEGVVFYDSENHTLSLYNDEADVTLQLGQEQFLRVRNNTGGTIYNGSGVRIVGAHGNAAPTVEPAIASTEQKSQIVGLAAHDIENETFGYVTSYGIVRDINTLSFSAGDELFLDASTSGNLTNVAPVIPNYKVRVGHVIRSDTNGSILVQIGSAKLGGGDAKVVNSDINLSGIPYYTQIANTNAGGMSSNSTFLYDSGNNQLQLGSGVQLLNAVPGNTTNVLYNDGGTLKFNGSAVDTDTTYTAGTGLLLSGSAFSTAGTGTFDTVLIADTGNFGKSLTVGSGVELLNATPPVTTNKLYNVGGELYFNGAAVSSGGAGGGGSYDWVIADGNGNSETVASSNTVYVSGVNAVTTVYNTGTNILTIDATDTNTTYTAGTGLQLQGTVFHTDATGHFDSVAIATGTPQYQLDVNGSGNIAGTFHTQKASKTPIKSNADGGTITFDLNESNVHTATLGGNRTMALSNPSTGQRFMLRLQQDATGNRTVTWFSTIKWAGVTPPTLSTSGNRADMFGFLCTSDGQYDGFVVGQNL
jgi:hypothetical protein